MEQQAIDVVQSLLAAAESGDVEKARTLLEANEGLVNRELGYNVSSTLESVRR